MKLSLTLSALVASLLLFQGCGDDDTSSNNDTVIEQPLNDVVKQPESNDVTQEKVTIIGKTTRGTITGLRKKEAIICVDSNLNNQCDPDEAQTVADEVGNYELVADIKEGDILLAVGGVSLLPHTQDGTIDSTIALTLSKSYNSAEDTQNINVISGYIVELMASQKFSYAQALEQISSQYKFDAEELLLASLDDKAYFDLASALEIDLLQKATEFKNQTKSKNQTQNKFFGLFDDDNATESNATDSNSSFFDFDFDFGSLFGDDNATDTNSTDDNSSILPSLDSVNDTIDEYSSILDNFFNAISDFFDNFLSVFTSNDINETEESNLSFIGNAVEANLTRDELNGAWFITSGNYKTCAFIQENDNITVIGTEDVNVTEGNITSEELNATVTNLVLDTVGEDNNIKIIEFKVGLFVLSDSIVIDSYTTDHKFNGKYASDASVVTAEKTLTLKACKEDKLGLTSN